MGLASILLCLISAIIGHGKDNAGGGFPSFFLVAQESAGGVSAQLYAPGYWKRRR